jgi:hypothetical protein
MLGHFARDGCSSRADSCWADQHTPGVICTCRHQSGARGEPHQQPAPLQPPSQQQQRRQPCQCSKLCVRPDRNQWCEQLRPGEAPAPAAQLSEQWGQQRPHTALTQGGVCGRQQLWRAPQEGCQTVRVHDFCGLALLHMQCTDKGTVFKHWLMCSCAYVPHGRFNCPTAAHVGCVLCKCVHRWRGTQI